MIANSCFEAISERVTALFYLLFNISSTPSFL